MHVRDNISSNDSGDRTGITMLTIPTTHRASTVISCRRATWPDPRHRAAGERHQVAALAIGSRQLGYTSGLSRNLLQLLASHTLTKPNSPELRKLYRARLLQVLKHQNGSRQALRKIENPSYTWSLAGAGPGRLAPSSRHDVSRRATGACGVDF